MQRLTSLAQSAIGARLQNGDLVVDATVGNGHDTLFLARCVAPRGQVIGFDVQPKALDQTAQRLRSAGLIDAVTLHRQGHEKIADLVPSDWPGRVAAVMFNLGYLPGGDKRHITRAATTLTALHQALTLLRPGGIVSVMAYRGHPGAVQEWTALEDWLADPAPGTEITRLASPGPTLYLIEPRSVTPA